MLCICFHCRPLFSLELGGQGLRADARKEEGHPCLAFRLPTGATRARNDRQDFSLHVLNLHSAPDGSKLKTHQDLCIIHGPPAPKSEATEHVPDVWPQM